MKKQNLLLPLLATLIATSTAHAQVLVDFSADDGAPTTQGFTPPRIRGAVFYIRFSCKI